MIDRSLNREPFSRANRADTAPDWLVFFPEKIDLGQIMEGDIVRVRVPFQNKSRDSVTIEIVSACECFEIDWPRSPLAPGAVDSLDLAFFSAAQMGEHEKNIDLILKNEDALGYPGIERLAVKMHVLTWDEKSEMDKKAVQKAQKAATEKVEKTPAKRARPKAKPKKH